MSAAMNGMVAYTRQCAPISAMIPSTGSPAPPHSPDSRWNVIRNPLVEQQEHLQFTDQTADDRANGDQLPFILFERRTQDPLEVDRGQLSHLVDDLVADVECAGGVTLHMVDRFRQIPDGLRCRGHLHFLVPP